MQLVEALQDTNPPIAPETRALAHQLLEQTLQVCYRFFSLCTHEVLHAHSLVLVLLAYVKMMSHLSAANPIHFEHAERMFVVVADGMQYPDWYDFDSPDDDDERTFVDYRSSLHTLFASLVKCFPDHMVRLTSQRLAAVLDHWRTLPYSRVHAALRLVYDLGEALRQSFLPRMQEEPLRSIIVRLFTSDLSSHPHPMVSLMYFQLTYRCIKFLETQPALLGPVVSTFFDQRGLLHSNALVRSDAAHMLLRVLSALPETLKRELCPFIDGLLAQLQLVVQSFLSSVVPPFPKAAPSAAAAGSSSSSSVSSAARSISRVSASLSASVSASASASTSASASSSSPVLISSIADCNALCECLGILVGVQVTGDACVRYVPQVMQFFQSRFHSSLASSSSWLSAPEPQRSLVIEQLSNVFDAFGHVTKPLSKDKGHLFESIVSCFELALQLFALVPQDEQVRAKTIFIIHSMVDCVRARLVQYLPLAIEPLIRHTNASNLETFVPLLNQLILTFRPDITPLFDQYFCAICNKVFEVLQTYAHIDAPSSASSAVAAYSTEKLERLNVKRAYYSFLKHILVHMPEVLSSPNNLPYMKGVMDSAMDGLGCQDAGVERTCCFILRRLVAELRARGFVDNDAVLKQFVTHTITERIYQLMFSAHLKLTDPNHEATFRELLTFQRELCTYFDASYVALVGERLVTAVRVSPEFVNEYLALLQASQFDRIVQLMQPVRQALFPSNGHGGVVVVGASAAAGALGSASAASSIGPSPVASGRSSPQLGFPPHEASVSSQSYSSQSLTSPNLPTASLQLGVRSLSSHRP